jgi:hypothetical protein
MAGWRAYDPVTGSLKMGLYERPFMIRGIPRRLGLFDAPEERAVTIASFRTREGANAWLSVWEAEYKKGSEGFAFLRVENWNE